MSAAPDLALTNEILKHLREAGFARVGVCDAAPVDRADAFQAWLAAGHHGDMRYMAEHLAERLDPRVMVPGARSVVCVADRYSDGRPDARNVDGTPAGRIARYARGRDYHAVLRERLEPIAESLRNRFPGQRFRVCVDTAPIAEREHAVRAGIGRIGKHTLVIGQGGLGSWIVLGAIVTTVRLQPTEAAGGDPCGSCTRCIDACPTQAIEPWKVKADRCISYLTIEHHGEPAAWFRARSDDWLFGCDACIEACPHSQWTVKARTSPVRPDYAALQRDFTLETVLRWSEADAAFQSLSPVLRRPSLASWKRNALLLAAGLSADRWNEGLHAA
ncbi:MAG: tRNA epoxyqueuosine(34) reductase QueG, partial [Phycisphaerales bacterium]